MKISEYNYLIKNRFKTERYFSLIHLLKIFTDLTEKIFFFRVEYSRVKTAVRIFF